MFVFIPVKYIEYQHGDASKHQDDQSKKDDRKDQRINTPIPCSEQTAEIARFRIGEGTLKNSQQSHGKNQYCRTASYQSVHDDPDSHPLFMTIIHVSRSLPALLFHRHGSNHGLILARSAIHLRSNPAL
jgi:hypothetical protein